MGGGDLHAFRLYVPETQTWLRGAVVLLQMYISSEYDSLEGRRSRAHCVSQRSSCFPRAAVFCHWGPQGRKRDLVWGLGRPQACNSWAVVLALLFRERVASLPHFYWSYWIKNVCSLSSIDEIFHQVSKDVP